MRMLVLSVVALIGCAEVKAVIRSASDVAHDVCKMWAVDQGANLKLTPQEFCAIEENVKPFIDAVLAAKRSGGSVVGARLGLGHGEP